MNYDHAMGSIKGKNAPSDNQGVAVPPMPRQGTDNAGKGSKQ